MFYPSQEEVYHISEKLSLSSSASWLLLVSSLTRCAIPGLFASLLTESVVTQDGQLCPLGLEVASGALSDPTEGPRRHVSRQGK